ncbi:MAG: PRC-barrel domain-containing protein [Methylibium sp.]|uniref:PRC-barrel domain-containing protein n=1 Tax=Methylibium sp. TaxID=2067992 RepID=UPI00182F9652|nr:PRC-barrel domain-containing protein [Methylibium sp.]MBA2723629.1 PRC-barrel domain-containing protein [Methylibium sp.]MBA3588625.1 PRC-barrel domain-containing protein [Methylibium sp.]
MHNTSLSSNTTLSKLARLALIPAAVAVGFSMPSHAQTNTGTNKGQVNSATTGSKATQKMQYRGVRASEMIGMSVRNPKGNNIGEIGDMIVDMKTGDVRYAILKFDPGILQGEELYAVPTTELRIAADRDDVVYNMSEAKLERAKIDRAGWDDGIWDDPDYLAKLDTVQGIKQPSRGARAHRASDLIGKDVNSKSGEKIGEIEELIVNMATQKVHYAVLEFDPSLASPEQNYAFPLTSFNLTDGKDELVLDITKTKLQAMKSFPDSRYENLNDRVWVADIDRYFVTVLPATAKGGTAGAAGGSMAGGRMSSDKMAESGTPPAGLFSRLDEDKNGSLDKAEVKDTADVDRNWKRFDRNGDNRISRDEFNSNYTIEPGR